MKPSFVLAMLTVMLGGASALRAQAAPESPAVRFRTLGWGLSASHLNYGENRVDVPLTFRESTRSDFYPSSHLRRISFYTIHTNANEMVMRTEIAEVNIKELGPTPLMILYKDKDRADYLHILAMADDAVGFPAGAYRFINGTTQTVRVGLGKQEWVLPPEGMQLVKDPVPAGVTTAFASVTAMEGGKKKTLYSNNWAVSASMRTLVLIKSVDGRVQVTRLADTPDAVGVPEASAPPAPVAEVAPVATP